MVSSQAQSQNGPKPSVLPGSRWGGCFSINWGGRGRGGWAYLLSQASPLLPICPRAFTGCLPFFFTCSFASISAAACCRPFLSRQCCFSINWLVGSGALSQYCFASDLAAPVYRAAFRQHDGLLGALLPFLSRQCCFSINWLLGSGALSQYCFCELVLD